MSAVKIRRTAAIVGFIGGDRAEDVAHMLEQARREPSPRHFAALAHHARGLRQFTEEQAAIVAQLTSGGRGTRDAL